MKDSISDFLELELWDCDAMIAVGFDDCIIGVCRSAGNQATVAYSVESMIKKKIRQNPGCSRIDAIHDLEVSCFSAYVGRSSPSFIWEFNK